MRDWRSRRGSAKNIWNMYVSNRQTAKRSNQRSCVPRNPTISHWSSSMGIDWFPSFIWYYNSTPRCFSRSSSPGSCKIVPNWAPRLVIVTFTKTLPNLGRDSPGWGFRRFFPRYLKGFLYNPKGGWPWESWTIKQYAPISNKTSEGVWFKDCGLRARERPTKN